MDRRGFNQKKQLVAQHLKHPCQLGFRNHTDHFFFLFACTSSDSSWPSKNASRLCSEARGSGWRGGRAMPLLCETCQISRGWKTVGRYCSNFRSWQSLSEVSTCFRRFSLYYCFFVLNWFSVLQIHGRTNHLNINVVLCIFMIDIINILFHC